MDKTQILLRVGYKGQFVKFPKKWSRRMAHTGLRRNDTSCDLILGVCACGENHTGTEDWILDKLENHDMRIETHAEWVERTAVNRAR